MAGNLETKITLTAVDKVSPTLRAIGQSFENMKKRMQGVSAAFSNVSSAAADFSGKVVKLSLVTAAVGGAFFALAKGQGQYAEQLQQMSEKTGFSTQSLQKWQFIAKLNNLELSDMTVGMRGLSRTMAEAASNPKSDMAKWFAKNKIAIKDAKGQLLPLETVMGNISEVFKNAPDGPAKMATAMKLLGRAGVGMIPILNLGKEKIAELLAEAQKYGFTLTDKMIKQQTEFDDSVDRLEWSISQLKMSIGSKLIPIFQPLVNQMRNWINVNRELIAQKVTDAAKEFGAGLMMVGKALYALGVVLSPVVEALGGLRTVIAAIAGVYIAGIALSFGKLVYALAMVVPAVWSAVTAFGALTAVLLANPFVFVAAAIALIGYALYKLITDFSAFKAAWLQLWGQVPQPVKDALRAVASVVTFGMSEVAIALYNNWESIKASFDKGGLAQVFADMFAGVKEKISAAFADILPSFSGFVDSIKSFLAPLTGIFDSIVNGIMKIKNAISGGISGSVNITSNITPGISVRGVPASGGAAPSAAPAQAAPAIGKTALANTPTVGNLAANNQPQKTHLDVYMKIDSEGRAKDVSAKSTAPLAFASNTGKMV